MATTLRTYGKLTLWDDTANKLYNVRANLVGMSSERDTEDILYFPDGAVNTLQILETITNSITWTFNVSTGSIQEDTFELIFNQQWNTSPSALLLPKHVTGTVPATPFQVAVSGLTTDQDVHLTFTSTASGGGGDVQVERVAASGSPSAGQFTVDTDTLEFNTADVGKTYVATYLESTTPSKLIGGTTAANPVGTLSFFGVLKPSASAAAKNIYIPSLSFSEGVEFSSDADNLELTMTMATPSGWGMPLAIW
jgi:hypothetical protein